MSKRKNSHSPRRLPFWLLAPTVLAAVVRFVYWLDYRSSPLFDTAAGPDVREYHLWAEQILSGQWLWQEVPLHGPAYAYWLAALDALTGQSLPAVRAIQLMIGLVGLVVVTLAMRKQFGTLAAACTAALWALHIPLVYYEAELFSESLACFLHALILAIVIAAPAPVNYWRCSLLGLLLGLSIITHPTAMILTLLVAAWLAWDAWHERQARQFWLNPLLTLAVAGLVVLPVSVHNSRLAGRLVLVQRHDGLNYYIGNNPQADGTPNVRYGPDWDRLLWLPRDEAGLHEESAQRNFYFQKAFEFIRGSTPEWLVLSARKFALALNTREVTASTPMEVLLPDIWLLRLPQVGFGVLLALAAVSLRHASPKLAAAGVIVLAFVITQTVFVAAGRYRAPMLPALLVMAGLGLQHLVDLWRSPGRRELTWTLGLAMAAIALAWLPVVPAGNDYPAEASLARANALWLKENWPAAVEELQSGVAVYPDHVPSQVNLGHALERIGRPNEAVLHFERAVAVEPDYPWALTALARARAEQGDHEAAILLYLRALENNPEYRDARIQLARLLASLERWEEATEHYAFFVARNPTDVQARLDHVEALVCDGQYEKAAAWLDDGVQRSPDNARMRVQLALLLATSPEAAARNVKVALVHARRAANLTDIQSLVGQLHRRERDLDPLATDVLDVLAIAYAANGSFDLAIKTAALAVRAAELSKQTERRAEIIRRLNLYRQHMPYLDQPNFTR